MNARKIQTYVKMVLAKIYLVATGVFVIQVIRLM